MLADQGREGGEQESGFRQCRWETVHGWLFFAAHPAVDLTSDARIAQLEPGKLDGHRTMLGVNSARNSCMMYVAFVAHHSSLQLRFDGLVGPPGAAPASCDVTKHVAALILDNLS